ncbi:hypothetical protein V6M85_02950 [Sulfolobus tengchongensis]|uniref:Permease n=1 Tax=Sulfolobus tengchongensis TaxID=207809 RepID=A0AAX4L2H2_9CREN
MKSNIWGYILATASSFTYSVWLLASDIISSFRNYGISLEIIMTFALILSLIANARHVNRLNLQKLILPILGGFAFATGNYVFYNLITESGLGIAGSFSQLNLFFFTLLTLRSSKPKRPSLLIIGSAISALGLGLMYVPTQKFNIVPALLGIVIAVLYSLGTYVLYITSKEELLNSSIGIFLGEVIFFFPFAIRQTISVDLIPWTILAGFSLGLALLLEANGFMKAGYSRGEGSLVNILSSLELIPIVVLYLIIGGPLATLYSISLGIVVIGIILSSIAI